MVLSGANMPLPYPRAHPSCDRHPILSRCTRYAMHREGVGTTINWQASAVVPGSSGHRCSSGHLSFHATDRAKNNVLSSLFSSVAITETVLWVEATDSIYPEPRGTEFPFCFAVFHHPFTAPNFFLTPCNEKVSFAVCRRIFLSAKTSRMGLHVSLQQVTK